MFQLLGVSKTISASSSNTHSLDLESGSSQYASIVNTNSLLNPTGNFTVECWFKPESLASTGFVVSNVVTDANTYGAIYQIIVNTNGSVAAQTWASSGSFLSITSSTGLVTAGTWYHVAFVKGSASDWKLYLGDQSNDDAEVASSTSSRTISATGKTGIRIGANEGSASSSNPSAGTYFDGLVDEVCLWGTNLSLATINSQKEVERVGNEANLNAYYRLNNDYTDETANAFDLTATNSPTFSTTVPF